MIMKACPNCGKEVLRGGTSVYCSSACQLEMGKKRYREEHPTDGKVCAVCGVDISQHTAGKKYCSDKCKNKTKKKAEYRLEYYAANAEKLRNNAKEYMARVRATPEGKKKTSEATRRYRENNQEKAAEQRRKDHALHNSKRLKHDAHVKAYDKITRFAKKHDAHVSALYQWKRSATVGELARFAKATGEPWNNAKLSNKTRYRIKYRMSLEFRLSEINRNTHRKDTLLERDDGTINFWELLKERKTCPYCETKITKDNAVADHMDPLSKGGNNTKQNLTICCRDCNQKKRAKTFLDWIDCLPDKNKAKALRWYKKKKGHGPEQQTMTFMFN